MSISALAGSCKRVRFRQSDCRTCQEICPENAISFDPGPIISRICSACGLCTNACPTEVFQGESSDDQYLLQRAQALAAECRIPSESKRFLIHCHRAESLGENSLPIRCLGSVTENLLLGAALSGFEEAVLTKGMCSRCDYQQGEQLIRESVAISRLLLGAVAQREFSIRIEEKETERKLVRRGLFLTLARKAKAIQKSMLGPGNGNGTRRSPRRAFLRKLLRRRNWGNAAVTGYQPEFRWAGISIDERKCSACGICVNVCPVGAIDGKKDNEQRLLSFNSGRCNNCRLCEEACPEKAINLKGGLTLKAMSENQSEVVARIAFTSCATCGQPIPAKGNRLCPSCEKRQLSPIQIESQRRKEGT